jgi:amino acid adenylation domain-containing protein
MHNDVVEGFRLSPQQTHLWELAGSRWAGSFVACCAARVTGAVDPETVRTAVRKVIVRHEILRTSFASLPGMSLPLQVIGDQASCRFEHRDLRGLRDEDRDVALAAVLAEAEAGGFDLEAGPLLAAWLVTLADADHRLILSLPALCADGVALGDILREVALSCGPAPRLPEPTQHVDLSDWQNDLLELEETAHGRAHWEGAGLRSLVQLRLPSRRQGAAGAGFVPRVAALPLTAEETAALARWAEAEGVPLASLLLAAWSLLLGRLSGRQDLVVGTVFDGRKYEEIVQAVGPFSRFVPVRSSLAAAVPFADLVRQVAATLREAEKWQEYFGWRETGPEEAGFSVAFELDPELAPVDVAGLRFDLERRRAVIDRFELKLNAALRSGRLSLEIEYDPEHYREEDVTILLAQLRALLTQAMAQPETPQGEMSLLGAEELQRLAGVNATRREWPEPRTLHGLFQAQAARTPERTALRGDDLALTYAELAARASGLARHLRRLGVGPETRVAICVERSPEMVIGLLGILGAGGVYVPLDPGQPEERLEQLIRESRSVAVVTQERFASRLPAGVPQILLDREVLASTEGPPDAGSGADHLAYVIYTSGSTGRPKGVMVSHGAITNRLLWMVETCAFGVADRIAHKTPFVFDASIWEIFVPLLVGAECVIAQPGEHQDPAALTRMVAAHGVTVLQLVPSLLEVVLAEPGLRLCTSLEKVFCGGEALSPSVRDRFFSLSDAGLHNLYGPTEVAIDATHHECRREDGRPFVPIGRPIANAEVHVLDAGLRLTATGEAGELYVGGAGLARGYLDQPALTAERFLPHPWSDQPGARVYRTGDRARLLADGTLEFLGRADEQVKLRGFRIEPGEIEAVLADHPTVLQAVVIVRDDMPGGSQLVAYAVPAAGASPRSAELRAHLQGKLPDYMVPAAVVVLPELPRTAGGKIDRRALPLPDFSGDASRALAAPRTLVEEMLAEIWKDLLQIARLGIHDNFFELGGHSLLATQLASRVRDGFRREISLRSVFEKPTIAGLAEWLASTSGEGYVEPPPLEPVPRDGELALSFGQQRLWFIDQLDPGSSAYNIFSALRLDGDLDLGVLGRTFSEVVRRHEVLRTTFQSVEGRPRQVIGAPWAVPLPVVDLEALPEDRREPEAMRLLAVEESWRFALDRGPLLRVTLLRLAPQAHLACVNMHHIVSDGWSSGVLILEVATLYLSFAEGRPSPLPDLPVQYADFAAWQRRWLQGEVLERQLAFWRERLSGAAEVLALPTDHPRPSLPSNSGAVRTRSLAPGLAADLAAFSRRHDATLFMTLLAAWQIQLHLASGQPDILLGTPIANRTRTEIEGLIGFFINTLVMRADLAAELTFSDVLRQARERSLAAHAHQDLPFEKLVDELGIERQLGHTPLFQVLFALQNLPAQRLELPGLALDGVAAPKKQAKLDLTLVVAGDDRGLTAVLEHKTALFDSTTADRMLRQLEALLASAIAAPERPLRDLALTSEAERHQILHEWNPPERPWAGTPLLHERFEIWARRAPERTALSTDEETLSYGELDRRANRLARHLTGLGVRLEVPVAICLDRSADMVVSLLAVLKAGGCYVPLDPALPAERLAFILADTAAPVVVTRGALAASLGDTAAHLVRLDEDAATIAAQGADGLAAGTVPENPAYVIYTSGSTGRPKGVVVTHANVLPLFDSTAPFFGFGEDDVWTLFHSYAFDFSVWEIWGALLYGGRLVVVPYLTSRSPEAFYELLRREGVTVLNQTPSAFRQLISVEEEMGGGGELALRTVVFGGEALDPSTLRPWFDRHGDERPRLVNMYGITETTVHVTWRPLSRRDLSGGSLIGGAIPDLRLYVLDAAGRIAPVGVPGEIHVGGAGLARGYLGRPELTAERFVPDPFSALPGARLYRTGDLARWRPDGDVEYLGRIDAQVKIRGFRIELGEIEAAVASHPGVREATVVVREDLPGDRRLTAYFVPGGEAPATAAELQDLLRRKLPDYMVPAAFVALQALPLTPNGKLDRRALPRPDASRSDLSLFVAPTTEAEEILAGVWSKVLGLVEVGARDNFFALGGDSILTIQVIALARARGLEVSLQQLFLHQTLGELAQEARRTDEAREAPARAEPFSLVRAEDLAVLPEGAEDAYPLTLLQAGMLFHMELSPQEPPYHNVDSVHLRAPFEPVAFRAAVQRTVARHPVLRTSFHLEGFFEPLQIVHREAVLPVQVEDLQHLSFDEQERVLDGIVQSEKRRLFDFTRPPQLRFFIHLRSADTFQLTLTENHAILDGWSLHSTLAEIFQVYLALLDGQEPPAEPTPSFAFRDHVAMERVALGSEELMAWWDRNLSDLTVTRVPRWAGPVARAAGPRLRIHSVEVPLDVSDGLKRLARSAAVPLKNVLLAAHLKTLGVLAGQTDLVTGMTTHGRPEDLEAERTRGLFLNTLPFRFALPSQGTWADLVGAVFEAEREMLPYRHYPTAALQKRHGGQPLFEVAFNYVHFHVVEDLIRSGPIEVLSFKRAEGTNFGLLAGFSQNLVTSRVALQLEVDGHELGAAQVEAIATLYGRVLAEMATDPTRRHEVSLLSAPERQQLLLEWNDTAWPIPGAGSCLHELIEAQVERTPDAVAFVFETVTCSYRTLDRRANALAWHLRELGAGPGDVVGIAAERSPELMVGLLAILKAGAAYMPLDPNYPQARLAFMLEQAAPPVVLVQRRLAGLLPEGGAVVLDLDAADGMLPAESGDRPASGALPADLAYVIYTSGSTGQPKGVMNSHAGIVNRLGWMQDAYRLNSEDRVLQKTPYSFDVSVWELFWPLLVGARLVLAAPERHRDSAYLVRLIADEGITTLHFVPSMLQAFLEEPDLDGCAGLRRVICSGEALPYELRQRFLNRLGAELHNLYGPTEAAVDVTAWDCRAEAVAPVVPIGRPIANLRVHLVDPSGGLAPFGTPGELCIGGVGVARGYLAAPRLTAERFVPDPFAAEPGARLYRTGDLARFLPGGSVEFLGRLDHQVKVRGFRIELGEIEAALLAHPGVRETVVVLNGGRLVAYLVGTGAEAPSAVEMRDFLRQRVPEYMVPARFVALDAMPLNPNGKLDRKALPSPDAQRTDLQKPYVAPRDTAERRLAEIWERILQVERVGIDDSFFELGGDSIRSIQVVAHARAAGIGISLPQLLEHVTLRELAPRAEWLAAGAENVVLSEPFSLISAADREKLPPGIEDAYPLAELQAGMLFHSVLNPGSAIYHDVVSYHLGIELDEGAVRKALTQILARHAVLRTAFDLTGFSEPLQIVHRSVEIPFTLEDVSHLSAAEQETAVAAWIEREKATPFEWKRAPLCRFHLHRRGSEELQLSFSFHHSILDGWSLASLLTELFQLYLTLLGRAEPAAAPLPMVTFRDFVALERAALASDEHRAFWAGRLEDFTVLHLPRWRRPTAEGRIALHGIPIPQEVSLGLRSFAAQAAVPLKNVLLAAHVRVLALIGSLPDVVTGLVFNGRPEGVGAEQVMGLFLNTLPFRARLGEGSWEDWAREVFRAEMEMTTWRRFPMAQLQRSFGGGRPLFETAFNFTHFHVLEKVQEVGGLEVLGSHGFEQTNFTLLAGFGVNLATSAVELSLTYDADNLVESQVEAWGGYYLRTLEAMARDPLAPVLEASLLTSGERQQLLVDWSGSRTALATGTTVPALFAAQVRATPDAPAVLSGGETLSYGELDRRANRLAHHLRSLGVDLEVPVGVLLERSAEMIVALLAVLKAGGAYVPLEPTYPAERLALMLADVQAPVVVSAEPLLATVPEGPWHTLCLGSVAAEGSFPEEPPVLAELPDALAYVLFTSGSTGRPKGVGVAHRSILRLVRDPDYASLTAEEVFLQLAPASFDASTLEIWGPLLNGGRLVVFPAGAVSPSAVGEAIGRHGVTTLWLTAGLFHQMVEDNLESLRPVRQLLAGGDVLSVPHVQRVLTELPDTTLINGYGPTENTTFTCCHRMRGGERPDGPVPIGRPISGTEVRVLDGQRLPVPVGAPGELCAGGDGLARGYFARPELTAERFVPDPFGAPGSRLYRTGDIVRWRPAGTIEFLGRIDHQVKIRGFRIELGEIEAALTADPRVRDAVVMAREDVPGDKRLVAYVAADEAVTQGELRDLLRGRLPDYMLPSVFALVDTLPLTPNGKVDRRALPAPEGERPELAVVYVMPRTAAEQVVVAALQDVLRVEKIGVRDDFFELGGHSLLATRAVARLSDAFQVELPLRDLFEYPTVEGLVDRLAQLLGGREITEEIAEMYQQVQQLSEEEVQALLS